MKSVKQMCLGVAVAGVVVGAGSTVATAVASAEPASPDTTQTADASEAGSSTTAGSRPQARDRSARSRAAAATGDAPDLNGASPSGRATTINAATTNAATTNTGTTVETPNNNRPRASVLQRAPRTAAIRATRTVNIGAESVSVPVSAAVASASEASSSGQPDEQVAAAAVVVVPVAFAAVPALPAPAPVPLLPLPTLPALPVAPATAVTVSSASSTTTRRGANAVAAAQVQVTGPTHVLLIGVDGVNMSKVLEYAYEPPSGFRILMDQGVTGTTSFVGHTTISGPSWSTILTGAWDDKTGVFNNIFNPRPYDAWPTAINLIEYNAGTAVDTAVIANWQYINDIAGAGGYKADINEFVAFDTSWEDTDDLVVARTIELIETTSASDSAFIFSYQVAVDEAGHEAGGDSPEYEAALINTSENIAAIMAAIDIWEAANPGQEWTVITTTDHGHQPQAGFGHGFQSPNETASWVIFDLEGDDTNDGLQNLGYSNVDITPTILNLFNITQRSDFDGVPLQEKLTGIVAPTDRKQSLTDALGMYGYPDSITDFVLSVRTVVGAVPYFLNGFVEDITGFLQGVVEQEIFLISTLAQVAEFAVGFLGGALVDVTQAIAGVVARLTGSGVIAPTDPPLPPPPAGSVRVPVLLPAAVLV